jgi:hypothetical protein
MAAKGKRGSKHFEAGPSDVDCEPLEPIGIVIRELERPDGTTLRVEVPVYPPFRLKGRRNPEPSEKATRRR